MTIIKLRILTLHATLLCVLIFSPRPASAAPQGTLHGRVTDPLGAVVPGASVALLANNHETEHAQTTAEGVYEFSGLEAGRYSVRVQASGFGSETSASVFVPGEGTTQLDVMLRLGTLREEMEFPPREHKHPSRR